MLKPLRLRTMATGLLVVAGSVVVGLGVSRVLITRVIAAGDAPPTRLLALNTLTPTQNALDGASLQEVAASMGIHQIYPNPADLFPGRDLTPPANAGFAASVPPLPTYHYSFVSPRDGNTYTGFIMGRDPSLRGKTTTTINVQIVPLVITINDGTTTIVYDPTAADPCVPTTAQHPAQFTPSEIITNSPLFTDNNWTMNGVNIGTTQYLDAFQRAQSWALVGGTPYHTRLSQSSLAAQNLSFNSTQGTNYNIPVLFGGGCGFAGVVNINVMDSAVRALINGPLAGTVNAGTVPIFLTKNVFMDASATGHDLFGQCCVLGYHSAFSAAPNPQVYSPFSLDSTGLFGGDVSTLSHEIGEAVNDPFPFAGNNVTPAWGGEGQVGGCQGNFEVGDPLSPGFSTPTNEFSMVGANGLTYHLQELAFFNWFYGGASTGAGGKYSNNGTFGGFAKACPPGGTN